MLQVTLHEECKATSNLLAISIQQGVMVVVIAIDLEPCQFGCAADGRGQVEIVHEVALGRGRERRFEVREWTSAKAAGKPMVIP